MTNRLYYGDNLDVLREHVGTASVDLVYLDPPFNSNANYNILFKSPIGTQADAQVEAFKDTWTWGDEAEDAFDQVMRSGLTGTSELLRAMRGFMGQSDVMAYLAMMAIRLIELHRALKNNGSLYLHCDPTASHYLKMVLDSVFGASNYRNEIVWQRLAGAKADAHQYGRNSDRLFFYSKSSMFKFDPPRLAEHNEQTVEQWYKQTDERGSYVSRPLTAAGATGGDSGQVWRGRTPTGHWTVPRILAARYEEETGATLAGSVRERLDILADAGFIDFSSSGLPSWRRYLDEAETPRVHDLWYDEAVKPISRTSAERLGYPTQKPLGLLERIIAASSNEGDVVLDPFCGCGTAVHAAQKLGRAWIGIDITHLAISLIEKRLKDAFPGIAFTVEGTPKDLASAEDLARRDKYQFQWWAVSMVDAMPSGGRKKGADGGVDGIIYFKPEGKRTEKAIVSVKGGDTVGVQMIRDLHSAMEREKAPIGVFITKALPSGPMEREAAAVGRFHAEATGKTYPRLQIITLAELFQGKKPDIPFVDPGAAFKRAGREETGRQETLL